MFVLDKATIQAIYQRFAADTEDSIQQFIFDNFYQKPKSSTVDDIAYALIAHKYQLCGPREVAELSPNDVLYSDAILDLKNSINSILEKLPPEILIKHKANKSSEHNSNSYFYWPSQINTASFQSTYRLLDPMPEIAIQEGPNCGFYASACTANFFKTLQSDSVSEVLPARKRDHDPKAAQSLRALRKKNGISGYGPIYKTSDLQKVIAETGCDSTIRDINSYEEFMQVIKKHIDRNIPLIIPFNYSFDHTMHEKALYAHWATIVGYNEKEERILLANYGTYEAVKAVDLFKMFYDIGAVFPGQYYFKNNKGDEWDSIPAGMPKPNNTSTKPYKEDFIPELDLSEFRRKLIIVTKKPFSTPQYDVLEKIENGTVLSQGIRLLPVDNKQRLALANRHQDKIKNCAELCKVLAQLSEEERMEFASQNEKLIMDGIELCNVLHYLPEQDRTAFAIKHENIITSDQLTGVTRTLLVKNNEFIRFIQNNQAKILNFEQVFAMLKLLPKEHRLSFAISQQDHIKESYNITVIIHRLQLSDRIPFMRSMQARITNLTDPLTFILILHSYLKFASKSELLTIIEQHPEKIINAAVLSNILEMLAETDRLSFAMNHLDKISNVDELDDVSKHFNSFDKMRLYQLYQDSKASITELKTGLFSPTNTNLVEEQQFSSLNQSQNRPNVT